MKSPPRARSPTALRILFHSGFGAENRFKANFKSEWCKCREVRVPEDHSSLRNAPEFDYSSFYATTGTGNTGCLVARDLALLTKVRTLIH
jgi:hypothetical protein